jgi:DNA-binding response OmpR family regulator
MGGAGARALVAVGDAELRQALAGHLRQSGLQVLETGSGLDALQRVRRAGADIALISSSLPEIDGLELLARVRRESQIPVILVVDRGDEATGVLGLEAGADDYVVAPSSAAELPARARAVMRRARPPWAEAAILRNGALELDLASRRCRCDGTEISLTRREFELMGALLRYQGRIHTREQLLELVWGGEEVRPRAVDAQVNSLRRKLGPDFPIVTLRGVGYRLEPR